MSPFAKTRHHESRAGDGSTVVIFFAFIKQMDIPEDALACVASFGRLSQWRCVARFDVPYAACCRIQREWRKHQTTARFVLGAIVRVCAKGDRSFTTARLVARERRGQSSESWTARLIRPGFRHYVYIRRLNDHMYAVTERLSDDALAAVGTPRDGAVE